MPLPDRMSTIIFSDIDGTILNSAHELTPLTEQAIRTVQRRGIPFVIVTARSMTATYPLLDQYGIECPVVTCSGGIILDEHREIIHHHGFSKAAAQEVVDFAAAEGLPMTWSAYSFEDWVSPDVGDPRVRNEEQTVMVAAREGTIESIEHDEVQKVLCMCEVGTIEHVERRLVERFPAYAIVKSSDILIEVMPSGTSKANAVRTLCALWGASVEDAVAFGDSYNDAPMLEVAGKGYLMPNAPAPLLEQIPLHAPADNDHDGVYYALRDLGLIG